MEITVTLSDESVRLLGVLKERGVYGLSKEDVAARFIDCALQDLVQRGVLKLRDPLMRRRSPDERK